MSTAERTQVSCAVRLAFRRIVDGSEDDAIDQAKRDAKDAALVVAQYLRDAGYSVELDVDYLVAYGVPVTEQNQLEG